MIPHTCTIETKVKITYHGTDLTKARENAGLSQSDLALAAGLHQSHISDRYERPGPITVYRGTFDRMMKALKKATKSLPPKTL